MPNPIYEERHAVADPVANRASTNPLRRSQGIENLAAIHNAAIPATTIPAQAQIVVSNSSNNTNQR